jgi:hypothetical protein
MDALESRAMFVREMVGPCDAGGWGTFLSRYSPKKLIL